MFQIATRLEYVPALFYGILPLSIFLTYSEGFANVSTGLFDRQSSRIKAPYAIGIRTALIRVHNCSRSFAAVSVLNRAVGMPNPLGIGDLFHQTPAIDAVTAS